MPLYLELWLTGPVWRRLILVVSGAGLTLALFGFSWLLPQKHQLLALEQANQQADRQVALLRRNIQALPQRQPVPRDAERIPFSLLAFVKQSGGRLIHWFPEDGRLHLLLRWEHVAPLFLHLARYQAVALSSFTLAPEGEQISLELVLEFTDDDA